MRDSAVKPRTTTWSPSTTWVAAGLAVLGLSSFGYLSIAAHVVAGADFARLGVAWTIVYTLSAGAFAPLEQALTVRLARGADRTARHFVAVTLAWGLAAAAATIGLTLLLPSGTRDHLLGSRAGLLLPMSVAVVSLVPLHGLRGMLAGNGRFRAYAVLLAVDGLLKVLITFVLALSGVRSVEAYCWTLAGAQLAATLLVMVRERGRISLGGETDAQPATPLSATRGLIWLTTWTLCAQFLLNSGVVVIKLRSASDGGQAGGYLTALLIARSPLFFAGAILSPFLYAASTAARRGDFVGLREMLRRAVLVVAVLCTAFSAAVSAAGSLVTRVLFSPHLVPGAGMFLVLGAGSGAFFIALLLTQALVSQGLYRHAAGCWSTAVPLTTGAALLPLSASQQAAVGLLAGALVVNALLLMVLRRIRQCRPHDRSAPGRVPSSHARDGSQRSSLAAAGLAEA